VVIYFVDPVQPDVVPVDPVVPVFPVDPVQPVGHVVPVFPVGPVVPLGPSIPSKFKLRITKISKCFYCIFTRVVGIEI
jgi:hypothetical protein